ncbi:UDP-N-acetylmuramoyl-tripeptide--D-alanyl-D-alanine ligase [uncultured Ruthenibacterium sp.]|mgnify:CR=1 FL=1|uniref:UDP-N-acetylmuramoyl-tripeptide--D-alanyl-D- alanine ligase n=1 Tax=uncultured Ruthenibacterium sp. TaxID=1905347 RepID=UPI00349E6831
MRSILANELCKGLGDLPENPMISGVVTDSREVASGNLFVCIKGERVDGHNFATAALEKGAAAVLCQYPVAGVPQNKCILVKDPLDAMIQMGANYRAKFSPVLLGVTGSVGKTTTKEFCYSVFSSFGNTLKTEGNQNNEIGVPRTLFRLDESVQYGVVEMGMQALGEIEKLTLAVRPAGSIITWIGQSHLESLGTRENILKAKMEICKGMSDGAPLVINADNDLLSTARVPSYLRRVTFSTKSAADVQAINIHGDEKGTDFTIVDRENGEHLAFIPTMGEHNVADALSAYALATRLGLDAAVAAKALANYATTGHRQNIVKHCGVTVIEDCYNASPDSMRAALGILADYPVQGRRIAILGDMFELGEISEQAHASVGDMVAKSGVDLLLTVGQEAQIIWQRASSLGVNAIHCVDKKEVLNRLLEQVCSGDALLFKASHGMALETILKDFYEQFHG